MNSFSSLWVGGPLTKIQEVSLASFVFYGHDITLYVYDDSIVVPKGVKKADAKDILPENMLFKVEDSYASFSDIFRYSMIQKTGKIWVDADCICLSSEWQFQNNIILTREDGSDLIVGGVLQLPQGSDILNYLVEESLKKSRDNLSWSDLGPFLLTEAVRKFGYYHLAWPYELLLGISPGEWWHLINIERADQVMDKIKNSKALSVYNQMHTRGKADKNNFPIGSAMDIFYKKFII